MGIRPWPIALVLTLLGSIAFVGGCKKANEPEQAKVLLFPTLADRQDQLQTLQLRGAGNKSLVTLNKKDGSWRVAERTDWPADPGRISQYLFVLSQTHREEAKTANPALYSRLGVEPITTANATGTELKLEGRGISGLLLIGNEHAKFDSNYVRVDGQAQAWLTDLPVTFDRNPAAWLDRRLVDLPLARVAEVRVSGKGEKAFSLSHRDDRFRLDDAPSAAMGESHQGDALASVLAPLLLDDLAVDDGTAQVARELQVIAVDGLQLNVQTWHVGDRLWLRLKASIDEARAEQWSKLAGGKVKPGETLSKRIDDLNRRFAGRRFQVPADAAVVLMLSHDEILAGAPTP
jgi:hypothetical protein